MYKIYQVEYGDTLELIAEKTNTTVDNIKNINGFKENSDLIVGSLIVVPNKNDMLFETYIVKQGDSLYSIARTYNIPLDTLIMLNGLNKNDYIYPNQEIVIPKSGIKLYVTKEGDTLANIINYMGIDANKLNNQNKNILIVEDQLLIDKRMGN